MSENIISGENFNREITSPGLGYFYFQCLKEHAKTDKIAQILANTDEKETFKSLLQKSVRTAIYLQEIGVKKNDIICHYGPKHMNDFVPFVSSHFIGAIPVCLPNHEIKDNKKSLLELLDPRVIFITSEHVDFLKEQYSNARYIVFGDYDGEISFKDVIKPKQNEDEFEPIKIEDLKETAIIFLTSGTTGSPKPVCINHFSILAQTPIQISFDNVDLPVAQYILCKTANIVTLDYLTFYSISSGLHFATSICRGFTRVVWELFNPEQFWVLVDKYKINYTYLAPLTANVLCKTTVPKKIDLSSLVYLQIAGAHVSTECILKLRKKLHPLAAVVQTYGQTEMSAVSTHYNIFDKNHRKFFMEKPNAVGVAYPGLSYKIVDIETNDNLGPNQHGEILVKSIFAMNGYYKMDPKDFFDSDDYYKTGDIGYYDSDNLLYIVDRIKGIFKVGWYRVHASEIEDVVLKHPDVLQVAVFGYKNKYDLTFPSALIVKKENSKVTENEVREFVNSQVEDYRKLTGYVKFIDKIPVTSTGKVKCGDLNALLESILKY